MLLPSITPTELTDMYPFILFSFRLFFFIFVLFSNSFIYYFIFDLIIDKTLWLRKRQW